jgi:hypothetical protein
LLQTPLIKKSGGGIVSWKYLKQQIETHLKKDTTAFVTTFIDYYGTHEKHEFPNWTKQVKYIDKNKRIKYECGCKHFSPKTKKSFRSSNKKSYLCVSLLWKKTHNFFSE